MRLMDECPTDPAENIALDAELFADVEERSGTETLRFWESPQPAVVVGSFGVVDREVQAAACDADRIPVLKRISGGGAVVLGPGCLNYSLVLSLESRPELRHVTRSYILIMGRVAAALGARELTLEGRSDLTLGGRKVGGSAQRRGRRALLHHGTILYNFDAALMERYLKEPVRQPAYRAGRCHTAFVANVSIDPSVIRAALVRRLIGGQEGW